MRDVQLTRVKRGTRLDLFLICLGIYILFSVVIGFLYRIDMIRIPRAIMFLINTIEIVAILPALILSIYRIIKGKGIKFIFYAITVICIISLVDFIISLFYRY